MSFYTQLRLWHFYYEIIVGLLSYSLTILVIYLAIYKTNKTMKQYSLIILLSSAVDFLYSTITLISMPTADMVNGKLFLMNTGYFEHVGHPHSIIIFSCYLFTMYVIIVNTTMIFVYRYKVLCCQNSFTMRKFCILYAVLIVYVALQSGFCILTMENPKIDYSNVISQNKLFAEDTPTQNVYDATKLIPFLHLFHGNIICTILYGLILYTGLRVHKCLNFSRQFMSNTTIKVQRQLSKIMILQAGYPLFCLVVPVLLFCSGPILHLTIPFIGIFLGCTVSLIPLINSLTTIFVISSFRRALLKALFGKRFGSKVGSEGREHFPQSSSFTIQGKANSIRNDFRGQRNLSIPHDTQTNGPYESGLI